jgi:hypothetical protein
MDQLKHVRARWPEPEVPPGEPEWLLYEVDEGADSVLRTVDIFTDGTTLRNSLEIEQRDGRPCSSLMDISSSDRFEGADLEAIEPGAFERAWASGVDTPVLNLP